MMRRTAMARGGTIVSWYSAEHGWLETVARGMNRGWKAGKSSPFAALDLFCTAQFQWKKARRGELHFLQECVVTAHRDGLRRDYASMLLASYCCAMVQQCSEPQQADPEGYDLLRRALDHIASAGASDRAMRHFEREMARLHGVGASVVELLEYLGANAGPLNQLRAQLQSLWAGRTP